eukprot:GHVU01139014.1.p1 GENE.GHVU01139014.1~~GHVU01139014.1.p1  ORF type:complete len:525 (+),score=82.83 GHVU01139014.1:304-1878(+)
MFAWWVIVVLVVMHGLLLFADFRILLYYEHPDDAKYKQGLMAKIMAILGLSFPWIILSILPTDAHNTHVQGGLNMRLCWQIIFLSLAMFMSTLIPFSVFYYEADSDVRISKTAPWKKAIFYTFVTTAGTWIVLGGTYGFLHTATVPYSELQCPIANWSTASFPGAFYDACDHFNDTNRPDTFSVHVGFLDYTVGFCSLVGWGFFVLFGGVGFAALPIDLIFEYIDRPKPIDIETFSDKKKFLGEKALALRTTGEALKEKEVELRTAEGFKGWQKRNKVKDDYHKYRAAVYLLEHEYSNLQMAFAERGENPALSGLKLFFGIAFSLLSVVWFFHIILYMIIPMMTGAPFFDFLSGMMDAIKRLGLYFIDLFVYMVLTMYLLLCIVKGALKFGSRIFCCFPVHPLNKKDTHLNAILFNVSMLILAACALAQFSQQALEGYAYGSGADVIFRLQMEHVPVYRYEQELVPLCPSRLTDRRIHRLPDWSSLQADPFSSCPLAVAAREPLSLSVSFADPYLRRRGPLDSP